MALLRFATGGLEDSLNSKIESVCIDGTNYVFSDKFKTILRDNILDWGAFLEIYHDNMNHALLFDEIVKLLNIKGDNKNLKDSMLPLVKQIYNLPPEAHITCMIKQFEIYEPVSIAIHNLFNIVKNHFEELIKLFVKERNDFIISNNTQNSNKINDWDALVSEWESINASEELSSSSVILLFLNWPKKLTKHKKNIQNTIQFRVKGVAPLDDLERAVSKFEYKGFCVKVPHQRLVAILSFPLNEFIRAIHALNPSIKFPNYKQIERLIEEEIKLKANSIIKPECNIRPEKFNASEFKEPADAIKWYTTKILEYRQALFPIGKKYEEYYIAIAKVINSISNIIEKGIASVELKH